MTERRQLGRVEAAEYSDEEGSIEDDGSCVEGGEWRFNRQIIFKNMLQVATRMGPEDRREQMILLSLAMSAITRANADSWVDAEKKIKFQEAMQFKDTVKKPKKTVGHGSRSSTSLPTKKTWSLEDQASVKKLRAMHLSWEDLSKYNFPERTGVQLQDLYNHWLGESKESAEAEKYGDEGPAGMEGCNESTTYGEDNLPPYKNKEMSHAPPTMSAFEKQRKANMAENEAILDRIAQPMECRRQLAKEKRRRPAPPSTPPNPPRRSERKSIARRTV